MECTICLEPCNKSTKKDSTCLFCNSIFCRKCLQDCLLLEESIEIHCPSCKVVWNREFIDTICTAAFRTGPFKAHREKVLVDSERIRLPDTQDDAIRYEKAKIYMEDYKLITTGQYGGIGALIKKSGDYIYISEPYEGNPAQKSGLRAGDKILSIDGKEMAKKPSDEVSSALKGPKGTTIVIKVERNGQEVKIPITRDEIKIPDVPYSGIVSNSTGYIKLNSFTQTASEEVKKAFLDLKSK